MYRQVSTLITATRLFKVGRRKCDPVGNLNQLGTQSLDNVTRVPLVSEACC